MTDLAARLTRPLSPTTVTVCDACFRASCWQGEFMCDAAKTAGTVEKTRQELAELGLEHPSYWDVDPNTGVARFLSRRAAR